MGSAPRMVARPRTLGILAGLVLLSGLAVAHVLTTSSGDQYTGVLLILDQLFTLTLGVGLFAVAAGVGGRVLEATGPRLEEPLETLLLWTAVGLGVLATTILVVGSLWSVRPLVLFAIMATAAILCRDQLRRIPRLASGALSSLRANADRFCLSILAVIALFLVTRALAPPADWDVLMYHLRVPKQFLEAGSIYQVEDNAHFGLVGLPHMLYLPLLAAGSSEGPALISAVCTLGLALTGFAIALRFLDQRTAAFHLAVLWGTTTLLLVGVTARTDTILAFYLLLVHYALLRAHQTNEPRFLYLGAALGGMAVGVKYTALVYLLVLAPLGLWLVVRRLEKRSLVLTLGLVIAGALPWLLKNGVLLGDPLYPFLGGYRLDPWLARLYGEPAPLTQLAPDAWRALWGVWRPFNLADAFLAPERLTIEPEGVFYHHNLLLLLLPLWLVLLSRHVLLWLAAPAIAYSVLIVLLQPTTSLRYLIPAVAPLTLVAFHAYGRAWDRLLPHASGRRVLHRTTALLVLAFAASVMLWHLTRGRQLEYTVGSISRRGFLRASAGEYADLVAFVNHRLPEGSSVLMLSEARGYYFEIPVRQDNILMNWPLLSAMGAARDCLRSTGSTHVLVSQRALRHYERGGFPSAPLGLEALADFTRRCLSPIYSSDEFTLFRLPARAEDSSR